MADGSACPLCFCSVFSLIHGLKYCDGCGSQVQDFMEEQAEFEFSQMTKSRAHAPALTRFAAGPKRARHEWAPSARAYAGALQALLRAQVAFLVANYGCQPGLEAAVRPLWRAYALRCGLLEPQPAAEEEEREGCGGDERDGDTAGAGAKQEGAQGAEAPAAGAEPKLLGEEQLRALLWRHGPPAATLELTYLGLLLMREALQPCDLVRAAMAGELPYLSWPSIVAEALGSEAELLPHAVLRPKGMPTVSQLMNGAAGVASLLGLRLPPINCGALAARYAAELGLPEGLAEATMALVQVHLQGSKRFFLRPTAEGRPKRWQPKISAPTLGHPYAQLMAVLVAAAKLAWGLDGRLPPRGVPPPPRWREWAWDCYARLERPMPSAMRFQQGSDAQPEEVQRYLKYCKEAPFASADTSEDIKRFSQLVEKAEGQLSEPAPAGATRPPPVAHTAAPSEQRGEDEEDALPLGPDHYECYWKARRLHAGGMHPDYCAVVVVAAQLLWVDAADLHRLVVNVEQACHAVEQLAAQRADAADRDTG